DRAAKRAAAVVVARIANRRGAQEGEARRPRAVGGVDADERHLPPEVYRGALEGAELGPARLTPRGPLVDHDRKPTQRAQPGAHGRSAAARRACAAPVCESEASWMRPTTSTASTSRAPAASERRRGVIARKGRRWRPSITSAGGISSRTRDSLMPRASGKTAQGVRQFS